MTLETARKIARVQRELLEDYSFTWPTVAPGAILVPSAEGTSWWPGRTGRPNPESDDAWLDQRIAELERAVAAREAA